MGARYLRPRAVQEEPFRMNAANGVPHDLRGDPARFSAAAPATMRGLCRCRAAPPPTLPTKSALRYFAPCSASHVAFSRSHSCAPGWVRSSVAIPPCGCQNHGPSRDGFLIGTLREDIRVSGEYVVIFADVRGRRPDTELESHGLKRVGRSAQPVGKPLVLDKLAWKTVLLPSQIDDERLHSQRPQPFLRCSCVYQHPVLGDAQPVRVPRAPGHGRAFSRISGEWIEWTFSAYRSRSSCGSVPAITTNSSSSSSPPGSSSTSPPVEPDAPAVQDKTLSATRRDGSRPAGLCQEADEYCVVRLGIHHHPDDGGRALRASLVREHRRDTSLHRSLLKHPQSPR